MTDSTPVRLDKWLWAARFYKTRNLAKEAIEGGKVHYNGARAKPSRNVESGATVRLRLGWDEMTVVIEAVSDKRRGAPEARLLYQETADSVTQREQRAAQRKAEQAHRLAPDQRPSKKQRRDIRRLKDTLNT